MNFQTIPPIQTSKEFLEIAFKKAREKGKQKKLKGNWLQIIRKKEALKLDVIQNALNIKLEKILETFPGLKDLAPFYIKLMNLTLDYPKLKKSLGSVNWAKEKIKDVHKDNVRKIAKEKDRSKIKLLTKHAYGRISSVLKQVDKHLEYLEECRKILRTYPDIKEMCTVCIYGFPNVGKSTLLNKLTGTKAQTAAYEFTTKTINAGYLTINNNKIQILDVPGTLAREEKMNNVERQAELVISDLADMIIYVFDISGQIKYSLKDQEQLLKKLGEREILIYLSKQDLVSKKEITDFKYKHCSLSKLKEKIGILTK